MTSTSNDKPIAEVSPSFLNALCWVNQTTFPADLEEDLVKLGAPADLAQDISLAYKLSCHRNLIAFYEAYAYAPDALEWQKYLTAYINHRITQYKS